LWNIDRIIADLRTVLATFWAELPGPGFITRSVQQSAALVSFPPDAGMIHKEQPPGHHMGQCIMNAVGV